MPWLAIKQAICGLATPPPQKISYKFKPFFPSPPSRLVQLYILYNYTGENQQAKISLVISWIAKYGSIGERKQ